MSTVAIGGKLTDSTSRKGGAKGSTKGSKAKGCTCFHCKTCPLAVSTVPGWVKCPTCTKEPSCQEEPQAGQRSCLGADTDSDSGDVHHLSPAGHLRVVKTQRKPSIEVLNPTEPEEGLPVQGSSAASAAPTLKRVSAEARRRF